MTTERPPTPVESSTTPTERSQSPSSTESSTAPERSSPPTETPSTMTGRSSTTIERPSTATTTPNPCSNGICENKTTSTATSDLVDNIVNGSNVTYERTVENVLNRNTWTNILAVVDVTGSMLPCPVAVYKWMTSTNQQTDRIKYYVFFNDGNDKITANKSIGSTGGLYGIDTSNFNLALNTMKTAMKKVDNQATPRDMILLRNVKKPVKVFVCQLNENALKTNLINIATNTGGSIHTIEQGVVNFSGSGTITIGTRTYRKTATGYFAV
ncbi:unnamed protein product [Rotaria socialis]|uniref:Uncharacterized protein n=1 Tax=Rotaria socialis TaxID=392032 RepID=A0A818HVL2_9BILA|nr:unnamed protein product [Rotaria socialis]